METQMASGLLDQAMSLEPVETSSIEGLQPVSVAPSRRKHKRKR